MIVEFVPPKPNEFFIAFFTGILRAVFGQKSTGQARSWFSTLIVGGTI